MYIMGVFKFYSKTSTETVTEIVAHLQTEVANEGDPESVEATAGSSIDAKRQLNNNGYLRLQF